MIRSMWKKIRRLGARPPLPVLASVAELPKPAVAPAHRSAAAAPDVVEPIDSVRAARGRPRRSVPAAQAKRVTPWHPDDFQVPPKDGAVRFHDLDLEPEILHAVADLQFSYCTPIQAAALPHTLAGRDVAGRAQTGTGKTAAFLIAAFNRFLRHPRPGAKSERIAAPRALIIAPTRELVMQIERDAAALGKYLDIRTLALYGGTDLDRQRVKLQQWNPELVVATPGRLLDFRSRRDIDLGAVEIMVIDEADRMLDMGFIPDVRRIVNSTPPRGKRQTLLFSATLSDAVMRLAASWLSDPERIDIEPEQVAVDSVRQDLFLVTAREKFALLYNIMVREKPERVLMFVNRRDTAEQLTRELKRYRFDCDLISGALSQNQRTRTMAAFREGRLPILVATDVAGRGLHIDAVSHVINYNIPEDPEDYVHRIGRTGRAGATGVSITFACEDESFGIPPIEEYIGRTLPCSHPDPEWLKIPEASNPIPRSKVIMPGDAARARQPVRSGRSSGGDRRGGGGRARPGGPRAPRSATTR